MKIETTVPGTIGIGPANEANVVVVVVVVVVIVVVFVALGVSIVKTSLFYNLFSG